MKRYSKKVRPISDVGMTLSFGGVNGVDKELIIKKFTLGMPIQHEVAKGKVQINAVIIDIDDQTYKASKIVRINEVFNI